MNLLQSGLRDLGAIFGTGLKLLAGHWPQLLALYLAGAAGRMGFLWLALWASKSSSLLGVLLLPLASICTLLSLVFMLRVIGESLPAFSNSFAGQNLSERIKSNLRLAAQVLIPFLAVYATQGLLREDTRLFVYSSSLDEAINNPLNPNYGRVLIASGIMTGIVILALIARKLIAANNLGGKSLRWGALSGYLEVLWMITLSTFFANLLTQGREWVSSRAVVGGLSEVWVQATTQTGVLGQLLGGVGQWLTTTLGSMSALVIVPVAWLAIGASIYGSKFTATELSTPEAMTRHISRIPDPLRRATAQLAEPITTPIMNTLTAISKVAAAGIIPMVLFCVLFALLGSGVKIAVAWLGRLIVGPQSPLLQLGLEPYITLVERGAYFILSLTLVAAAVNRVLMSKAEKAQADAQETAAEGAVPLAEG